MQDRYESLEKQNKELRLEMEARDRLLKDKYLEAEQYKQILAETLDSQSQATKPSETIGERKGTQVISSFHHLILKKQFRQ